MSRLHTRRDTVDAPQRDVERREEAPAPRLGAAELLALQRTAGNAAVSRLIQRWLHIRRSGHEERFTRSSDAERYLQEQYELEYDTRPQGKAYERLRALAKDADMKNKITRTWLRDALAHIHTGERLRYERGYVDPKRSPEHRSMPDLVEYRMGRGQPPSRLRAPASPRATPLPEQYMDVDRDMKGLFDSLGPKRDRMSTSQKKNLYAYTVRVRFRCHELVSLGEGLGFIETGAVSYNDATVTSSTYQSAATLYETGANIEDTLRMQLDALAAEAKQRPKASKSAFPNAEPGKFTKRDADGNFKFSAAQPYFHSETQADSQVATEAPRLARALMEQIIQKLPEYRPLGVVVQNAVVVGASDEHTVCGGACKHALCHITKQLDAALTKARHDYKQAHAPNGVYIRGSEELVLTTHVQGRSMYNSGFGKMNGLPVPVGEASHGRVVEYQPRT